MQNTFLSKNDYIYNKDVGRENLRETHEKEKSNKLLELDA
ncbi:hypothetical protein FTV88_0264 [Heliorestis convoluta]|uniref:Uncharacterized protein n=1 Tax=Heliorestis convoluta TaxID=356322 RepID=A0A5Q2MYH4_9FIRM|nr:hypothetical protein FTV88_0264 [Heliorestis convoluta]